MKKFIKLNDIQAKKIAGKYNGVAIDPRFIEIGFYIIQLGEDMMDEFAVVKRYLKKLSQSSEINIIDMANTSDVDVKKINSVFNETMDDSNRRISKRVTKWDYTKVDIKDEL